MSRLMERGENKLWYYIIWVGKMRPKKSQPAENICWIHQMYLAFYILYTFSIRNLM